jgi:hypothetical protein
MNKRVAAIALCCSLHVSLAVASPEPWHTLPPTEREALSPLYQQWNNLPETQQHNLRHLAQHYPKLDADAKRRFLSRVATWAQLTPALRQAAREKYRAFSQVPAEKREQVKQMVRQNQTIKAQQPASAASPAPVVTPAIAQP